MAKKVVLVGTAHPFRGGLASYNERLIKEFKDLGDDASIETFTLQYPNFLFPGKTQYSDSPKPEGIEINETVSSVNPFNWIKIGRKIKKQKPDYLIFKFWLPFMGPCFGTIARIAKKNKHTKVISIIDNIIPHEKRIGDKVLSNYFVKPIDGFVAMSQSVLDDLNTFDSNKPKLYNPHPLFDNFGELISREAALKELNLSPENRYILFFGFVRDYKGLDLLLDAYADSRFIEMNVKLIVAGEYYNNEEQYTEQIKRLKLENEVILRNDFIPNEEVKNYFRVADIIAQPYKNATQSGVTQIGYHFEKPMLVTNVGGLAELIPHNKVGYVVEPNSQAIADALVSFFKDNKKEEFERNVKLEKEKFSWKKMVDTINTLADDIQK
jgi:glycosyltransferase involved in cell wall biosynthesis